MSLFGFLLNGGTLPPPPNPIRQLYEVGRLYVWRQHPDIRPELHGKETTVTSPAFVEFCMTHNCYHTYHETDTVIGGETVVATDGDLIPKNPPPGESLIHDLIKNPKDVEEPEVL